LSKIKENKLNSIKSEMEQIKKYIVSSHTSDNSKHYDKNFSNNNSNDTLTLTKVVENENKIIFYYNFS